MARSPDHLLPKPPKLARGHHAAMAYDQISPFIGRLRERESPAAIALEFCILTAARSGEVLGARWSEIDIEKKIWTISANSYESRSRTPSATVQSIDFDSQEIGQIEHGRVRFSGPKTK